MNFGIWRRPGRCSAQRRIAHAEACAYMLGKKFDRRAVADWIGLGQIFHGFDQCLLPVNVAWIAGPFSFSAADVGGDWNRKDFGHEMNHLLLFFSSISAPVAIFSLNLRHLDSVA